MGDRVVCGILDNAVRHKLLVEPNLTLDKAVKTCRAEEAAQQTGDSLPSSGLVNATRHQSSYKRRQASLSKSSSGPMPPPASGSRPASSSSTPASRPNSKCSACGRTPHTKNPCPPLGWTCGRCHQKGHFASMCPQPPQCTASNVAHLSLSRASTAPSAGCISAATQLRHASTPCPLTWLPNTGSGVDTIGLHHLSTLGEVPADLSQDADTVSTADGRSLSSLGKTSATLLAGSARHQTTIHVYDGLTVALLSKASLAALGYLPQGWPQHVRSTAQHGQQSATSGWVRGRYRYLLLLRKVAALQRWTRSRSGRAEDRSTTNCGETFCLVICLSFVWLFFFPSRSNIRLGLLIEFSKLTCFAREKATWFQGGEIDDRRRLLSGVLAGQRASWKRGKIG